MHQSTGIPQAYAFTPSRVESVQLLACVAILTAVPALIDLFTFGINVTMLYVVPLLLLGRLGDRRRLWPFTILALCLTYGLYFLDFGRTIFTDPDVVFTWRLMNRSMVAVSLCVVTTALYLWRGLQQRLSTAGATSTDPSAFDEMADALLHLTGLLLCAVLIGCIALADFGTPGEFNLPLLYAVPLVIAHWMGSRRLLWVLLPVMIVLSIIGFKMGQPATVSPDWLTKLLTNRSIAIAVLMLGGVLLHFFIGPRENARQIV